MFWTSYCFFAVNDGDVLTRATVIKICKRGMVCGVITTLIFVNLIRRDVTVKPLGTLIEHRFQLNGRK